MFSNQIIKLDLKSSSLDFTRKYAHLCDFYFVCLKVSFFKRFCKTGKFVFLNLAEFTMVSRSSVKTTWIQGPVKMGLI